MHSVRAHRRTYFNHCKILLITNLRRNIFLKKYRINVVTNDSYMYIGKFLMNESNIVVIMLFSLPNHRKLTNLYVMRGMRGTPCIKDRHAWQADGLIHLFLKIE